MIIQKVKCDKCGRIADLKWDKFDISMVIPIEWKNLLGKDLCPDCHKFAKKEMEKILK
jgi:ssDNA-binding Zn-finger/Zn-ribbon topoisomerase 1